MCHPMCHPMCHLCVENRSRSNHYYDEQSHLNFFLNYSTPNFLDELVHWIFHSILFSFGGLYLVHGGSLRLKDGCMNLFGSYQNLLGSCLQLWRDNQNWVGNCSLRCLNLHKLGHNQSHKFQQIHSLQQR